VRRSSVLVIVAVASGLLSVLLAIVVNVATGGSLPEPLTGLSWLAWPMVGVVAMGAVGLAAWQQRIGAPPVAPGGAAGSRAASPPAELPAAPAVFAGRDDDLGAVDTVVAGGCRIIALVGPPGVGKTSLALRIAHNYRERYPDGQLFAVLRGADSDPVTPESLLIRFLRSLAVSDDERQGPVEDLAARMRSALADRRMLIVLDDARDARQVQPLLPGGGSCLMVITSRRILTDLPDAFQHLVGGLDEDDARALLAGATQPGRMAEDPDGTRAVIRHCGGLPLALGIAAARLRARPAWTPGDLAARLADERRRLEELQLGHLAVRTSFAASYVEQSAMDRLVFRRAGSHPGRVFGAGAAAALAGVDEFVVTAALERLVDAHLVESPAADRFRLHDLLRLFALERLAEEEPSAESEECLGRLLDWLAQHARKGDWLSWERDNVLAAVGRGVESRLYEQTWTLVEAVDPLLQRAGDHADRLALWSAAGVAATALGDERRRVRTLYAVSFNHLMAGNADRALSTAQEAVTIAERLGDPEPIAHALFARGRALRAVHRYRDTEASLVAALALFAQVGNVDHEIGVRGTLGTTYNVSGRAELAVPVLERAVELLPKGTRYPHTWTLQALTVAYKLTGRRDEAADLNQRVLDLARETDDEFALAYGLQERGWLAMDERRYHDALQDMRSALTVFEDIRNPSGIGGAHEAIGAAAMATKKYDIALVEFDAAIAILERLGYHLEVGRSRLYRAHALAELRRIDEARREQAKAEALLGNVTTPELDAMRARLSAALPT
jgi:tetratricopeptide (TPR) repeat protein